MFKCPDIEWTSSFVLFDSPESDEGWCVSVSKVLESAAERLGIDLPVSIDIAQQPKDIHVEFASVNAAYEWLMTFVGESHLEHDSGVDFRDLVYYEDV